MTIVAPSPTSVYLYRDRFGILIYVGITGRGIKRNLEHNDSKDWWSLVASQEVEHYPSRDEALARERDLIVKHSPPFNRQHNTQYHAIRAAYLSVIATQPLDLTLPQAIQALPEKRLRLELHDADGSHGLVLRTRLEEAQVASALRLDETVRVHGFPKKPATVQRIEHMGPFALIFLTRRRQYPLIDAVGAVKCNERKPLTVANIRSIQVRFDREEAAA